MIITDLSYSKTKMVKDITRLAWKNLGTAKRGEIAEEFAKIVLNSNAPEKTKIELLASLSRFGWSLKILAEEGYGYNTATGGKWTDSAGKLNKENKGSFWVYS